MIETARLQSISVAAPAGAVASAVTSSVTQAEESTGFPWPVAVIGGAIIVAGLVALRGEFGNWCQRRAERAERADRS